MRPEFDASTYGDVLKRVAESEISFPRSDASEACRRSGVEDRWTKSVRDDDGTVRTIPSAANGQGMRRAHAMWTMTAGTLEGIQDSSGSIRLAKRDNRCSGHGNICGAQSGLLTVGAQHAKWVGTKAHLKATTVSTRTVTWSAHVETRCPP